MSSKQASKPNPRVAKKEVIVTRHKSAQMKRQLRVKDRSMKHITDLLKSPTRDPQRSAKSPAKKTPPKLKQSLLQSIEKVQKLPEKVFRLSKMLRKKVALARDEEYYPNKKKRNIEVNRVVLKPNHDLKLVGGITGSIKRKCAVPQKATKSKPPKAPSPVYAELSMAEVIQLMEDDLTDEDMMEILTCPSPVWWEDPPSDEYIEDAIFTKSPEPPELQNNADKMQVDEAVLLETDDTADKRIEITNLDAKSDNFLKKRSKLEGVLGNIKHNTNTKVRQNKNNIFNEDIVVLCSGYRKHHKVDELEDKSDKRVKNQTLSESDGDETLFHDGSMNVEEFINDLENMDIPIENEGKSDVIVIDDDDDVSNTSNKQKENKKRPKKEMIKMKTNSDETLHMLKNVPVLMKYRLDKFASPKSFDSSSSKTSRESQDIDSISDTNVKFLLDEDVDEQYRNTINEDKIIFKKESNKNQSFEVIKKEYGNETTTVYKIIEEMYDHTKTTNNDVISKSGDDKDAKMNDYYKTCKKFNQKKSKRGEVEKSDINKNEFPEGSASDAKIESDMFMSCEACKPQTKKVSDDKNVKYCLKCSCIFDSTDCTYCIEKSKTNVYKCVSCRIKFCCEAYFKVHALSHMEGLET